jgi:sporulation protein YlmC with PRC-barrel domain
MLLKLKDLHGYNVAASDAPAGEVKDTYFDDVRWVVRYLVVDTRAWISGREVLISPLAVTHLDREKQRIDLSVTQKQVDASPSIDAAQPVSRMMETQLNRHYGYPDYWMYGLNAPLWGWADMPVLPPPGKMPPSPADSGDPGTHLRSAREVIGYHIKAKDGETFGHVEDVLVDPDTWALRYLLVDTRNWWPGQAVIVGTEWANEIDWGSRTLSMDLDAERIKACPPFDPAAPVTRQYEQDLHRHYGRSGYWGR